MNWLTVWLDWQISPLRAFSRLLKLLFLTQLRSLSKTQKPVVKQKSTNKKPLWRWLLLIPPQPPVPMLFYTYKPCACTYIFMLSKTFNKMKSWYFNLFFHLATVAASVHINVHSAFTLFSKWLSGTPLHRQFTLALDWLTLKMLYFCWTLSSGDPFQMVLICFHIGSGVLGI